MSKIVLITGSSKGIGDAIATKYENVGYKVIRNGRTNPGFPNFIEADITDIGGLNRIYSYIKETYGKLDIIINNAAWTKFIDHNNIQNLNELDMDRMISTNIKAPFFLTQKLHPLLTSNSDIVNIASVAGTTAQGSNIMYCATKAALINMTKSLARALGPIKVNSVSPGLTLTDFVKFPGNYIEEVINETPLNKAGLPKDIADVVFSITEHMQHITGQDFIVDGGKILNG